MGQRAILINEPPPLEPKRLGPASEFGWYLLGVAGWVFLLAGVADVGLAWIPLRLGNPEWEFGTITRSLEALPVPFLGAALILAAGVARGRVWWGRLGVGVLAALALWVVFSGVLYGLNVPLALRSVKQPEALYGLKKAVFRTSLQVVLYAVTASLMVWLGARTLRQSQKASPS